MAIFRGIGGAGDSTTDATVTAVTEQAVNAATSATQAASSASSAASSASSASTSATNAAASASTASDAATAAQTAQTNAETAETNAETAETNAETAETNAAASASSASTSATNASNSATAASNSATAASNSASAAATSATNAENAYDSFDDRYLGVKASDPALDNDGAALLTGALYFNSTDNEMRVYTGSVWIAVVDLAGDVTVTSLTASSVDINGGTIDGVTIGGASAGAGTFTALTTGSTVTLNGGTANGVAFLNGSKVLTTGSALVFDSSNRLSVNQSSSLFGAQIEVTGNAVGQAIGIHGRASDGIGNIVFGANGSSTEYARIQSGDDISLQFGVGSSGTERMRIDSSGNVGIGQTSPSAKLEAAGNLRITNATVANSAIFQVTSDATGSNGVNLEATSYGSGGYGPIKFTTNNTECMRIASTGNVGIGTSSPAQKLHVNGAIRAASGDVNVYGGNSGSNANRVALCMEGSGAGRILVNGSGVGSNGSFKIDLADSAGTVAYTLTYDSSGNLGLGNTPSPTSASGYMAFELGASAGSGLTGNNGDLYINENAYASGGAWKYAASSIASAQYNLGSGVHRWFNAAAGTANNNITWTQAMTLDASGRLGIGTTSPTNTSGLEIQTTSTTAGLWVQTGGTTSSYTIADFRTGTNLPALSVLGNGNSIFQGNVGIFTTTPAAALDVTGTVNATTVNTTNIEVTNIKAKDGTSAGSIADSTGVVTLASSVLTTADINGGTIDGVTMATSDITVGAGKTLDVSAGTLTLANDQISGDKINGGTIGATTITTLASTTGNITTVNATTVDTTNLEVTNIKAKDGTASATIADSTGVMTIASAVLTTADINGGTADNVTIGGGTAAAGTFTTATATTGNITTVNATTVDTTNIEVTNVKAKDGTASATIADSTGVMTIASSVLTTTDINGGTIDGVTIGGTSAGAITGTTITGTQFSSDATDVELKYSGSTKLATTSTGIDVTGTVTADDEIIVDGASGAQVTIRDTGRSGLQLSQNNTGGGVIDLVDASENLHIRTQSTNNIRIQSSGDISFYEDSGTSENFYWDASTSRLGLGTTSPEAPLEVAYTASAPSLEESDAGFLLSASTSLRTMFGADPSSPFAHWIQVTNSSGSASFPLSLNPQGGGVSIGTRNSTSGSLDITNGSDTSVIQRINGADETSEYIAFGVLSGTAKITAGNAGGGSTALTFEVSSSGTESEAMRIDSSGNLLVGTTDSSPENNSSGTSADDGIALMNAGYISACNYGAASLFLNRTSTDGDIVDFRKDGTTVGSIGVSQGSALYIVDGSSGGIRFGSANEIIPCQNNGLRVDSTVALGQASYRWTNLYLSGGVYLGGTGSANLLDDYEEGSFTPVFADATSGGNESDTTLTGKYVKVGALVYIQIIGTNINTTGLTAGNNAFITGLPFTVQPTGGVNGTCAVWANQFTFTDALVFEAAQGTTYGRFVDMVSGSNSTYITVSDIADDVADFKLSLTYRTDS